MIIPVTLEGHTHWVRSVCVSPDGAHIVTGSYDDTARVWRMTNGKLVLTLSGHRDSVNSVCFVAEPQTSAADTSTSVARAGGKRRRQD